MNGDIIILITSITEMMIVGVSVNVTCYISRGAAGVGLLIRSHPHTLPSPRYKQQTHSDWRYKLHCFVLIEFLFKNTFNIDM